MGLFNKKELREIESLKEQLAQREATICQLYKYRAVADVDAEIARLREQWAKHYEDMKSEAQAEVESCKRRVSRLQAEAEVAIEKNEILTAEANQKLKTIKLYDEEIEYIEYGYCAPKLPKNTSDELKAKIEDVRQRARNSVANGYAVRGGDDVVIDGSIAKGRAQVKRWHKLLLRAFNGECDALIANVRWNNYERYCERIKKNYESLNKVYVEAGVYIAGDYLRLKLEELKLVYEYQAKKHEEQELAREERAALREEEKARKEIEAAIRKAEREQALYEEALERARVELLGLDGESREKMEAKIAELERRLSEAEENGKRALSMAQQTRRGYVYVISNIGSFGEGVFKIGMTRRLDPMERVIELGDASVPFRFDVHALILSEDAPALETALHNRFEKQRVNFVNGRKEFFRVSLEEVKKAISELGYGADFISYPEAVEYRQSEYIRQEKQTL